MAESIAESVTRTDAIAHEVTPDPETGEGAGAGGERLAAELGVDLAELSEVMEDNPLGFEGMPPIILGGINASLVAAFLWGVRWEQKRGTP